MALSVSGFPDPVLHASPQASEHAEHVPIPSALAAITQATAAAGNDELAGPPPPAEQADPTVRLFQRFIGNLSDNERSRYYIDRERWVDFEYELRNCRSEKDLQRLLESYNRIYQEMPLDNRARERINAIRKWLDDPQRNFQTAVPCILSSLFDDKEPGYRAGMVAALQNLRLGERFHAGDYQQLHDTCVGAIEKMKRGWRSYVGYGYGIIFNKITSEAQQELKDEGLINFGDGQAASYCQYVTYPEHFVATLVAPENLPATIDGLFENYYQNIRRAGTDNKEKLQCIARLCRALEILHAFLDGNQRTIAFALLNKLLLENEFPPAILKDPLMFDGYYSVSQMVELILEGIEFTCSRIPSDDLEKPNTLSERQRGMKVQFAAGTGDLSTLQNLLESGAISPEDRGKAVQVASKLDYLLIVSTLLELGKISDNDRGNALCAACNHGYYPIVCVLLESGAISDKHLRNALEKAARQGDFDSLQRLLQEPRTKQYLSHALEAAAEEGKVEIIERLLKEPESRQYIGIALQVAVTYRRFGVIERLLREPESRQYVGNALQVAVTYRRFDVIERLLGEPESRQYIGIALQVAAELGRLDVIERLLQERMSAKDIQAAIQKAPTAAIKIRLTAALCSCQQTS